MVLVLVLVLVLSWSWSWSWSSATKAACQGRGWTDPASSGTGWDRRPARRRRPGRSTPVSPGGSHTPISQERAVESNISNASSSSDNGRDKAWSDPSGPTTRSRRRPARPPTPNGRQAGLGRKRRWHRADPVDDTDLESIDRPRCPHDRIALVIRHRYRVANSHKSACGPVARDTPR